MISDNLIKNIIKRTEEKVPNGKLIYLTLGGSHLFGLNTKESDIDIKGIFISSTTDTLSFKPAHLDFSTNKENIKNTKEDIDIELFNLHSFFDMINKGDTNCYDLLFSMFRKETILIETKESNILKKNYRDFLSTNSKSFLGYIVAQTKRYGIKGERYKTLKDVHENLLCFIKDKNLNIKNRNKRNYIMKEYIFQLLEKKLNYVKIIDRTTKEKSVGGGIYIEILNKEYHETVNIEWFLDKIERRLENYGERSKSAAEGVDFKSLSHALRIIEEFKELMETHFIEFPLKKRTAILKVKNGNLSDYDNDYLKILSYLDNEINNIKNISEKAGLLNKIKYEIFNKNLIEIISVIK